MKKRPLLSAAMRKSSNSNVTPQPVDRAAAVVDTGLTSSPRRPDPTAEQGPSQVGKQLQIDTLPAIYADTLKAATRVASQAWREGFELQLRVSAYMFQINRSAMSGRMRDDRTGD